MMGVRARAEPMPETGNNGSTPPAAFVRMRGITKRFGADLVANDDIDFDARQGEVHALLGENGAGKSTLMNILYGMYDPDGGSLEIEGTQVRLGSPSDAIRMGIGMIHQEFMLIEPFTVTENLTMGTMKLTDETRRRSESRQRIIELSREHGLAVDPDARIEDLSVGERQRVEILKLLFHRAQLLILDEPTAVLTPQETGRLFETLDRLRASGKAIVIVTHKMPEVMAISDRVSVLRDGRLVASVATVQTSEKDLIRLMVGRDIETRIERSSPARRETALNVSELVCTRGGGHREAPAVSFELRAGEILGVAGVDGNGQSELVETLFGLRAAASGAITLYGEDVTHLSTAERRTRGVAYVPGERGSTGTLVGCSIADNIILTAVRAHTRNGLLDRRLARRTASAVIARFGVKAPGPDFVAGQLSGGNLQKLVLGREVSRQPRVLLVEQPTRGLDVSAIEMIWSVLITERNQGAAILMVSTELEEVLNLSDRIAVMFEGRIMGTLPAGRATAELLGTMMAGRAPSDLEAGEHAS